MCSAGVWMADSHEASKLEMNICVITLFKKIRKLLSLVSGISESGFS
jgi:hypothetical protein